MSRPGPRRIDGDDEEQGPQVAGPRLPTIDDEEPPAEVDYRDWRPEDTKVVSGPLGPAKNYPGRRFRNKAEARRYWLERAGRIHEDNSIQGRYAFRVRRDA